VANRIDLFPYGCSYLRNTSQALLVSFIRIAYHYPHVGSRWVYGEDSISSPRTKTYNVIADMAVSRLVSAGLQRPQGGYNDCPPFTHSIRSFWQANFYFHSPPFKLLIKILSMWCRGVSRRGDVRQRACIRRRSVHFTSVNIILAVLIIFRLVYHRRCVRNTLGVEHGSPYTNIITMCAESSALFSTDGHFQWPAHQSVFRAVASGTFHARRHPSYLRRSLRTQRFLMHIFDTTRLSPHFSTSIALPYVAPYLQSYCHQSK
jgi:hypothetical protein